MKPRLALALLASLLAAPLLAGTDVIAPGTDLWHTPGDGTTYIDFSGTPLPADFFCLGSGAFAGRVVLRGAPLAVRGARLGNTDTILERLDAARFDESGVATTRVRLVALSLESTGTIETVCGAYSVKASLVGKQPATEMKIYRANDGGGHFVSALALNSRIVFEPVAGNKQPMREITRFVQSIPTRHPWATQTGPKGIVAPSTFETDSDGNGTLDRRVPASSVGFAAGWSSYIDAKTGERNVEVTRGTTDSFVLDSTIDGHGHAVTPPVDDEG